jgi:DDE superfamily endonuclease
MTAEAAHWETLLAACSGVFTTPSFQIFIRMLSAWALCPGRRTVTRIYQITEPLPGKAHDAYHRFLREADWSMAALWKLVAVRLVSLFYLTGKIPIDTDDTLFHKSGRKVNGCAWWRDAVRSTGQKVVHAFGLNLVTLTLRVKASWGGEPLGLPVNMRLHRKNGASLIDLADEMVREVASWFPDRAFDLCCDGFYAPLAGHGLPRTHVTSRMRQDAALYELPPMRKKNQRGRPRKRGSRLPTPIQMAQSKTGWRRLIVEERGKRKERLLLSREVLWYSVLPDRPVLLVISRDPKGKEKDDFFFTTDLACAPEEVVARYSGRWSIEDTFKNVKQSLGGHEPQSWKAHGPERASALSLWLYSLIWLWYIDTLGSQQPWTPRPWYSHKTTPSFVDAIASLRRALWSKRIFSNSDRTSISPEIIQTLINVLANAA